MIDLQKFKTIYGPPIVLGAIILISWQLAANMIHMAHILPGPIQIAAKTWELREALILHHLPPTLLTILLGWLLSLVIGVSLAVMMHFSSLIEAMLHKILIITQTIPVMCISPLFVLWLGYTIQARLIAVVLSTFFAITLNTYDGLSSADRAKRELMQTYGAGRSEIFFRLEVPSAIPKLITALKMTMPWAVVDAAVAEWLGANQGLGYFSKRMISRMDGAAVFAPLLVLCLMALLGMALMRWADRKYAFYRNEL